MSEKIDPGWKSHTVKMTKENANSEGAILYSTYGNGALWICGINVDRNKKQFDYWCEVRDGFELSEIDNNAGDGIHIDLPSGQNIEE